MIRSFYPADLKFLREIHEKFYKNEFPFPEIHENFLCMFTSLNDNEIVLSGGLKVMLEAIAITDKSKSLRSRVKSLYELLDAYRHFMKKYSYTQIHTTVINDDKWRDHLLEIGFKPVKGEVLVLNV